MVNRKRLFTRVGNFHFFPNDLYVGRSLEYYGEWAFYELQFISTLLRIQKPGSVVIAGANYGYNVIFLARKFENYIFYCFEPVKELFELLIINIAESGCKNIRPFHGALSNYNGNIGVKPVKSDTWARNYGTFSIDTCNDINVDYVIPVYMLDDLHINKLRIIYLDSEGHENEILEGAIKSINSNPDLCVFAEINDQRSIEQLFSRLENNFKNLSLHDFTLYNKRNFLKTNLNIFKDNYETFLFASNNNKYLLDNSIALKNSKEAIEVYNRKSKSLERDEAKHGKQIAIYISTNEIFDETHKYIYRWDSSTTIIDFNHMGINNDSIWMRIDTGSIPLAVTIELQEIGKWALIAVENNADFILNDVKFFFHDSPQFIYKLKNIGANRLKFSLSISEFKVSMDDIKLLLMNLNTKESNLDFINQNDWLTNSEKINNNIEKLKKQIVDLRKDMKRIGTMSREHEKAFYQIENLIQKIIEF